jgi:hypothetical protein
MRRVSDSALSSPPFAEPGQAEVEAALAAMSPAERLAQFWRLQEIAIARSWALVERSGLMDPRAQVRVVIRSRYPEWPDADVARLLGAICAREDPAVWLERLRLTANETTARLGGAQVPDEGLKAGLPSASPTSTSAG